MRDTTYAVPAAKTPRVVNRNQKADGKITEIPNPDPIPPTIRGDGGLYSTAPDYARFVQMILNHGQLGSVRLLKEQTVREMARNQTGHVKVRLQPTAEPLRSQAPIHSARARTSGDWASSWPRRQSRPPTCVAREA